MQEPNKKLLHLTRRYNKVKTQYYREMREYVDTADPLPDDDFFRWTEELAKELSQQVHNQDPVKSAIHNCMIKMRQHWKGTPLDEWAPCARYLQAYRRCKNGLYKACWEMPGVDKRDDGYNDWIDALPLAGRNIVEAIKDGRLAKYEHVHDAVNEHTPNLSMRIMEGENYITMTMQDYVIKLFARAVERIDLREEPVEV